MKRILLLILAGALALSLCACGAAAPAATSVPETSAVPESSAAPAETDAPQDGGAVPPEDFAPALRFESVDLEGAVWDESCFAQAELTMLNFWEPWCPPCVAEMPELQKLYEDYREQGLQILGVYGQTDMRDQALEILAEAGVSYPILEYDTAFDPYQSGFVPTTIFVDKNGQVVGESQIGALDYAGWAALVESLL